MLKFFKGRSNYKVKVMRSKVLLPKERSYQKKTHVKNKRPTCITIHSKGMANVQVFADKHLNR